LDAVRADWFDGRQKFNRMPRSNLGLMRLVTTKRRFLHLAGRDKDDDGPKEGDWLELTIVRGRDRGMPPLWVYSALDDYVEPGRAYAESVRFLDNEIPPSPVGASVAAVARAGPKLRRAFDLRQLGAAKPSTITQTLTPFKRFVGCLVHDVGQANHCALTGPGPGHVFVDIGAPIAFNAHTAPAGAAIPVPAESVVVITHWDWDHIAAGLQRMQKQNSYLPLKWIAPAQVVGANAFARIVRPQYKRGNLLLLSNTGPRRFRIGPIELLLGSGTDRNNSGITVIARCGVKSILLPGDAAISDRLRRRFDAVVVSHTWIKDGRNAAVTTRRTT
jgi:hypothetical protein